MALLPDVVMFMQSNPQRHTMYPYSTEVTPAAKSHLDAQFAYINEMSTTLTNSFQHLLDMNIQLGQSVFEEFQVAGRQMLGAASPSEAMSAAASHAQPASRHLSTYRQNFTQAAADIQVELARVSEKHGQETARTAGVLADTVKRAAADETERGIRQQQDTLKNARDAFGSFQAADGVQRNQPGTGMQGADNGSHVQAESERVSNAPEGNRQGTLTAQQPNRKDNGKHGR
jgi:phasin family protein